MADSTIVTYIKIIYKSDSQYYFIKVGFPLKNRTMNQRFSVYSIAYLETSSRRNIIFKLFVKAT